MTLDLLKTRLAEAGSRTLCFVRPDGSRIPAHAHVTEVARIEKRYVDCGGTSRADRFCRLQVWVADDLDHRLTAAKLLSILKLAGPILGDDELEVDVEHEVQVITQSPLDAVGIEGDEMLFWLTARHTDCLAKDRCLPAAPAAAQAIGFRPRPAAPAR